MGWTVNFAHPSAIPVTIAMLLAIALPLYFLGAYGFANTWVWWATIATIVCIICFGCAYASSTSRYSN